MKQFLFLSVLFIFAGLTDMSAKTVWYVKPGGTGDGKTWAAAAGSIQDMIDKAAIGDEVWVAKGTYYPTKQTDANDIRSKTFILKDGVHLYGGFAGNETTIASRAQSDKDSNGKIEDWELTNETILSGDNDGVEDVWAKDSNKYWRWTMIGNAGNCYRVVTCLSVLANETRLTGFTVTGGNTKGDPLKRFTGAGIDAKGKTVIEQCTVTKNYANAYLPGNANPTPTSNGGGINNDAGVVNNCYICNNASRSEGFCYFSYGGGISNNTGTITNCTISNNSVSAAGTLSLSVYSFGGGAYNEAGEMINCTITGNSSFDYSQGGGVFNGGSMTLCYLSNNCSRYGGGVYSTGTMNTCTAAKNTANEGGGIYNMGTMSLVTANDNTSSFDGGGIYNKNGTLIECTAGNNSGDDGGGIYNDKGVVYSCTISDNNGLEGGGIYSTGRVRNSRVMNNDGSTGGGIYNGGGIVNNCIVTGNTIENYSGRFLGITTAYGGGIYNTGTVSFCVVSNNFCFASNSVKYNAYARGGGIFNKGTVEHCCVSNNSIVASSGASSLSEGGGTYNSGTSDIKAYIYCTTVVNNTGDNMHSFGNDGFDFAYNCISSSADLSQNFIQPTSFAGTADNDAERSELQQANWQLKNTSVYVDAGSTVSLPATITAGKDLAGKSRIHNSKIDAGAYEYDGSAMYTVTFDTQVGSTVSPTKTYAGNKINRPVSPIRVGYLLDGWYKEAACTNAWNFDTDVVSANTTLYAKWATTITYTVTFNTQGGSAIEQLIVNPGWKATQPANPRRVGYRFVDWYKEEACTNLWNFNNDKVTTNVTLYAKWSETTTYTVTFEANGGSAVEPVKVNQGDKIEKPADPVRAGYIFGGWYIDLNCTNAWDFSTTVVNYSRSLYAKWTKATGYTVIFNTQGGNSIPTVEVASGAKITRPADPVLMGYIFDGWYKEVACTNAWNFGTSAVTANTTLYAKWKAVTGHTVAFNTQGGSTIATVEANANAKVTRPSNPVRAGYLFVDWYKDAAYTNTWSFDTDVITANTTLYAKWKAAIGYTVIFDSQGGSVVATIEAATGTIVIRPTDPTRTGYTFDGWYKEIECTNAWNFGTDVINDNVTLYARWTEETTTGIEITEKPLATMYPNPTDGLFTLNFDVPGSYRVTITTISGKVLLRQTVSHQVSQMNISAFPAGMYLLVIENGKQQSTTKIVKR